MYKLFKVLFSVVVLLFVTNYAGICANAAVVSVPVGTRVPVLLQNVVSSSTVKTADTISATIAEDVLIDGAVVFHQGDKATLNVQKAQPSGNFGRPGRLELNGGMVFDVNGDTHPVNISYSAKGRSRRAFSITMTVLSVPLLLFLVGLLTLPVAIMTSGKDAMIGEGLILDTITTSAFDLELK